MYEYVCMIDNFISPLREFTRLMCDNKSLRNMENNKGHMSKINI